MWASNFSCIRSIRTVAFLAAAAFVVLVPAISSANTFSVSLPAGAAVTMGDSSDTLSFTVSNDATSARTIKTLFFNIDTSLYSFSAATLAPTTCTNSWSVQRDRQRCSQPDCISLTSSNGIPPGDSCTFDLILKGPNDNLFVSAPTDQTDTLISVVASRRSNARRQRADLTLTGSLPPWQRKSLAISMTATPSVGVGDAIEGTMTVVNRSSAVQSLITGSPSPPTPTYSGGALTSPVGSPVYDSTSFTSNPPPATLENNVDASQTTIPVFSASGFPSSGTILIGTELISYTGISSDTFTGATRGTGGTSAASHSASDAVYSQNTSSFTLAVGETSTIKWIFSADATGTVYFTSRAQDTTVTATSKSADSGVVVIGNFTAIVSVTPLSGISGQQVTVTMTVNNNGTSTLTNVVPTLTPGGTATATLVSGPTPASIATLGAGESGSFEWTYTITGTLGQTYFFTGFATSDTLNTNSALSETGLITVYSATVTPDTVVTGTTSFTATWTVYNNGARTVKRVDITIPEPLTANCSATSGWGYQSDTPPANWSSTTTGAPVNLVTFTANNPINTNGIRTGQSKDFSITFNCVPSVTSDTTYTFPVQITNRRNRSATVDTEIVVTAFALDLEVFDEDCTSPPPASKPADGLNKYCFQATLTTGGAPMTGKSVAFSITSGIGSLSASSGVTDASGQTSVLLTSPCSTVNVSTTVKAEYTPTTTDSKSVLFTAIAAGTLNYVSGSLTFNRTSPAPTGDINPVSIDTGDAGAFRLDLMNCGPATLTVQTADSSLAVTTGSPDVFDLSGAVLINPGATATLNFVSGTIASTALQCFPLLTVNAGAGYFGPFSFNNVPPGDLIDDTVTVSGGTECSVPTNVLILDWREIF